MEPANPSSRSQKKRRQPVHIDDSRQQRARDEAGLKYALDSPNNMARPTLRSVGDPPLHCSVASLAAGREQTAECLPSNFAWICPLCAGLGGSAVVGTLCLLGGRWPGCSGDVRVARKHPSQSPLLTHWRESMAVRPEKGFQAGPPRARFRHARG